MRSFLWPDALAIPCSRLRVPVLPCRLWRNIWVLCLGVAVLAPLLLAQGSQDWQKQVRDHVSTKDLSGALALVEERLQVAPDDFEAHGWRGRILAWTGKWQAAEFEYRFVLSKAPNDVDILAGLADTLIWQQRWDDALVVLDQASSQEPNRADILVRRGRVLRALHQTKESQASFRKALVADPDSAEAKQGLESLRPESRHELRIGTDNDFFNFADAALTQGISLTSKWNSRWSTSFAQSFYQRFGEDATQFSGAATWRFTDNNSLTMGGAVAHDSGVIARSQAFFELGHGFRVSREGMVRGLEVSYQQRWLWFADARVLALTPAVTFYLPNDWTWSLSITPARSRFPLTDAAWQTSGLTRIGFPLVPRVTANLFYAVGTENFAVQDQIGSFSARTMGGGARFRVNSRQDLTGYLASQDRSQGRSQTSLGLSYGIRF